MKKRFLIIILLLAFLLLLTILFEKILFFNDVKQFLTRSFISVDNNVFSNNITVIDVTGIVAGEETEHEHIYTTRYDGSKHWEECKVCAKKQNETLHSFTTTWKLGSESCYKNNLYTKTCTCGYSETGHTLSDNPVHAVEYDNIGSEKLVCLTCGQEYGTYYEEITTDSNTPLSYTIITHISLTNGATFNRLHGLENHGEFDSVSSTVTNNSNGSTDIVITSKAKFKSSFKSDFVEYLGVYLNIDGEFCWTLIYGNNRGLVPDKINPEILSITTDNDISLSQWRNVKPIIVSGTENWTNTVKIEIIDDEENTIFSVETTVNNGSYSISCTPELEASLEGRKFKTIVTDSCENSVE